VRVTPPVPSGAAEERCAAINAALPARLDGLKSRPVTPDSPLTHAWGKPAVTMRCGVPTPKGYGPTSSLSVVDGVSWFQQTGAASVTWTTLQPGVNVALTVPTSYQAQAGFLIDLGKVVHAALH
jgi:hypothetical protein